VQLPARVEITEVGPRDGFQNIKEWIPTETKIAAIEKLIASGIKKLEVTAFVNPKAVPQMADARDVLITVKRKYPGVQFVALAPNLKGVNLAIEAGADAITYIVSASERHNLENTRQTIDQSLQGLEEVCKIKGGTKVILGIPMSLTCPWLGKVPAENVVRVIERGLAAGVDEVNCADTIGSANPLQVKELASVLHAKYPKLDLSWHLHDTQGMGLANVLAALKGGATRFEASFGGLGGCPFAPGAAGNIATQDMVNMLHGMGIETGIDLAKLMEVVRWGAAVLPVPMTSHLERAFACSKEHE